MVEILYKSVNAVVIYKPHGTPSQPDPSGDPDAMTLTSSELSRIGEPSDIWLIHRLDRGVGGLMIFARNKKSAAELSRLVRDRLITKEYLAVVDGAPADGEMRDLLFKDSRTSRAYVVERPRGGVREAVLQSTTLATVDTADGARSLVRVVLGTGRFHQIRAQLSHRAHPILGDRKYGSRTVVRGGIALAAFHLEISLGDERIDVTHLPSITDQPWSLFSKTDYERALQ